MSDTMRILHFVPKDCFPVNTGAKLRNYYFARELAANARITYLAFADNQRAENKSLNSSEEPLAPLESFCEKVSLVAHENSYSLSKIIRGLVGRFPLTVLNYTTDTMAEVLRQTLADNEFDIIHVESLLLAAYLPIIRAAKNQPLVVCDWHNIDSEVMQRYSKHAPSLARKIYATTTAKRLQILERNALAEFDGHFVVSQRDRKKLLEISPDSRIFIADNGVDCNFYSDESIQQSYSLWKQKKPGNNEVKSSLPADPALSVERYRLLFVGSMDYHANIDAVEKFVKESWQAIYAQNPQITFTVVGRNPSPEILALANFPGVQITGTVEDVRPFYREAFAAVVPLRIGGGSRLKILEAMAAGVPVISTRLGAEGIDVKNGTHIMLAESNEEFSQAISELYKNKALNQEISHNGRIFMNQRYDWSVIGRTLFNSYKLLSNDTFMSEKIPAEVTRDAFEVSA